MADSYKKVRTILSVIWGVDYLIRSIRRQLNETDNIFRIGVTLQ